MVEAICPRVLVGKIQHQGSVRTHVCCGSLVFKARFGMALPNHSGTQFRATLRTASKELRGRKKQGYIISIWSSLREIFWTQALQLPTAIQMPFQVHVPIAIACPMFVHNPLLCS